MSISELGSLGEFISSIAVLVTLAYLALQIRQNTHATRAASHHAITDALNQVNLAFANNPVLTQNWIAGQKDRQSLSEEKRWEFDSLLRAYFHVCDTMYYQSRVGAGDEGLLQAEEEGMLLVLTSPGGADWWAENPFGFSREFRDYIANLLGKHQTESSK